MRRTRTLVLAAMLAATLLAACEQTSIAEQERISGAATLQASTPSAVPTALPTETPIPPPPATATEGPTPTPTPAPPPSATPPPPSPTPNPGLAGFSFCNQTVGDAASGRFSARLSAITVTTELEYDRLVLNFAVPGESPPPHASARCLTGTGTTLELAMPDWLQDSEFAASTITTTIELSGTAGLAAPRWTNGENGVGAALTLDLPAPRPFRVTYEANPPRIVLDIARASPLTPANDVLTQPVGSAQPSTPVFYLRDGDVWRYTNGQAENLTNSAEAETALAVRADGQQVVFCRAAPGTDASDAAAASQLWLLNVGGSPRLLSDAGRTCAEPAYSLDGKTIAYTASETLSNPPRLTIYTVDTNDGQTNRATAAGDEWSRYGPQWLADGQLVYAANAEDGRSALFVRNPDGQETDIGAQLIIGDRYRALGRPLAARDGSRIAVEGWRATGSGADLLILDASGAEQGTVSGTYWTRPLAWTADNTLLYLTTSCASDAVQEYTLRSRPLSGGEQVLLSGTTAGAIGAATASGNGLVYVAAAQSAPGPRGPLMDVGGASSLWFWDGTSNRVRLVEATTAINAVGQ